MTALPSSQSLTAYFSLTWLLTLVQVLSAQGTVPYEDLPTACWAVAAALTYALMYVTPALLLALALHAALSRRPPSRHGALAFAACTVFLGSLTQVLLYADRVIVTMYGFHINR